MNATDCSVNNNPLVQLNKHTQQQNEKHISGHRHMDNGFSSSQNHPSQSFKSTQNAVTERDMMEINNFQNRNLNMPLNLGQAPDSLSSSQWSLKNQQNIPAASPQMENISNLHVNNNKHMSNGWSREFKTHNISSSSSVGLERQKQQNFQNNGYQQNMNMYTTSNSASNNILRSPVYQNQSSFRQNNAQTTSGDVEMNTNWDEQFGDLEKEVSENLHITNEKEEKMEEENYEEQKTDNIEDILIDDNYQDEFQKVWDSLHDDEEDLIPDRSKYLLSRMSGNMEYEFEDSKNEYLNNPNSYKIGCILMENGARLSEAAMAFEAAVREDPKHVDAWLRLGMVQIQNEKELNGMNALETCLKLEPNNLEAMKTLAISYINEGYDMSALTILNRWIECKYPEIDMTMRDSTVLIDESMEDQVNITERLTKRFLNLANQLPQVDPDVQLCLGLLYYADDSFDKTIECFNAALEVNPSDELMWNRLGAALANSNKSEESIAAYHRALKLKPSFVRARYNLAVSCLNIGCYKEATEHLLATLSMHEVEGMKAKEEHGYDTYNNDNIIETLKRVFLAMNRNDLLEKVKPGMDLSHFRGEFKF